jgi:hypothetical protein
VGGARLWSVAGPDTTVPELVLLPVVVCASASCVDEAVPLGGADGARLDGVPVDAGSDDDKEVVGIHDDDVAVTGCTLGGREKD